MTPDAGIPREVALKVKYRDDALQRIERAERDYLSTHLEYVPELASLLLIERGDALVVRHALAVQLLQSRHDAVRLEGLSPAVGVARVALRRGAAHAHEALAALDEGVLPQGETDAHLAEFAALMESVPRGVHDAAIRLLRGAE